jgi:ubiquinone/menaquinone biosynthesis C-methylase UbiE
MELAGVAEHRRRLLAGVRGRVVEIGSGNGLCLAHYPPEVTEVAAVEPDPYLRSLALRAAQTAPVPVRVLDGVAESLPFEDAQFDAAVAALVLCSVRDPRRALGELRRVLVPGGELRYYEHVVSRGHVAASAQRLMDATLWPRIAGGCHMARDTGALIREAGFAVQREERIPVGLSASRAPLPHLIGIARA